MLPFVFEDGFGYERYVDYVLDVPMYFVFRDGRYIDVAGPELPRFPRRQAARRCPARSRRVSDWIDHLSTAFPEVRLKSFLEMRGADGGPWGRICALPALWVGLLYDDAALDAAWDVVKTGRSTSARRCATRCRKLGLDAPMPGGGTMRDLAREVLAIAGGGLDARARAQRRGRQRRGLPRSACARWSPAARRPPSGCSTSYHGEWGGDVSRIYEEFSF